MVVVNAGGGVSGKRIWLMQKRFFSSKRELKTEKWRQLGKTIKDAIIQKQSGTNRVKGLLGC